MNVRAYRRRRHAALRSPPSHYQAWGYQEAFLTDAVAPHARLLAEQLSRDLGLAGETYVRVGWDDVVGRTLERIPPSEITPT